MYCLLFCQLAPVRIFLTFALHALRHRMAFVECSAKTAANVNECFESLARAWAGGMPVSSNAQTYEDEEEGSSSPKEAVVASA